MTGSSLTAALDAVDEQLAALEIQAPALNFEGLHGALDQARAAARPPGQEGTGQEGAGQGRRPSQVVTHPRSNIN